MLDLIAEKGPGGNFVDEPRSVRLARREIWAPTLLDRTPHVLWEQEGAEDMAERVWGKVQRILRTHRPAPLESAAAEQIATILAEVAENG